jgi:hypothetical protein
MRIGMLDTARRLSTRSTSKRWLRPKTIVNEIKNLNYEGFLGSEYMLQDSVQLCKSVKFDSLKKKEFTY